MSILEDFAGAMTKYEQSKGIPGGYRIHGKAPYSFYMSNEAWNAMLDGMPEAARDQFGAGSGGELEEKDGRPPKMAAFFSSSRMVYLLSKDWPGFVFEKQLPTYVGGKANLDGYLEKDGRMIFVEAKCREPYGHHSPERISDKYLAVYDHLASAMPGKFGFHAVSLGNGYSSVAFLGGGKRLESFDLKQMICHLLAVAGELLQMAQTPERVEFLYLIYDPAGLPLEPEKKQRIMGIYDRTVSETKALDMAAMFGHIVDYLLALEQFPVRADVDQVKKAFSFAVLDQTAYASVDN